MQPFIICGQPRQYAAAHCGHRPLVVCRPGKKNTDMAIPFVACGTPSRRSEFKHDDVKLMLTQLAYLQRGLNRAQVQEGMHALLKAAPSQQETLHRCGYHDAAQVIWHSCAGFQ